MVREINTDIYGHTKPPLSHEALRDVIDLALWTGQLLLTHGAETQRVEETIHRLGTSLGCNWMDILVSPNAIIVTASSGEEFRTKTRRVVRVGVNLTIVDAVNNLSRSVNRGLLTREQVRAELRRISDLPAVYNRWIVVVMVGIACAAFSRLLGGDWPEFFTTLVASGAAMIVRQELSHRYFNAYLIVIATAFVAGLIAGAAGILGLSTEPQTALAASVLLLVPGVPLINASEDMIEGHLVIGLTRGIGGALISLCIALGLLLAIALTGVGL